MTWLRGLAYKTVLLSLSCTVLLLWPLYLSGEYQLNKQEMAQYKKAKSFYGERAGKRYRAWRRLIAEGKQKKWDEKTALKKVNRFFNWMQFSNDPVVWGAKDYWATPLEFLGAGAGDCEDYSIAKYMSLRELGVPDKKMRLVYVKALSLNQFHMVTAYYPTPTSVPLILDNIDGEIKPATKRKDLAPIYSFNGSYLWLMKAKGKGQLAGSASRLKRWTDLKKRFSSKSLRKPRVNMDG
ncbi:transglutaminase-like cysteine peptidase [Dongshaea marina]|uniref:transglutaminase-like cysteine peptidase n=1 Tax=Dongshaea marina TaxID=2047966 RepID=UPI000D3E5593|nr:transglutaminase-like cysteine peptidase [Dongshaea marina]